MRTITALLLALSFLPAGCSYRIAQCGANVQKLKTRDEVRQAFGEPSVTGDEDGETLEQFRTRRKIAEWDRAQATHMAVGTTNGLLELIFGPVEIGLLVQRKLVGQDLRFYYDANGSVTDVLLNGECLSFLHRSRERHKRIPDHIEVPTDSLPPGENDKEKQVGQLLNQFDKLFAEGRIDEAREVARKARELDPDDPAALVRLKMTIPRSRQPWKE
jgi:hypothetical protein